MKGKERNAAQKAALYGMLIALAFIFSYVEAIIPMPLPVPGVKIGLANLVNVVGLYTVGLAGTAAVGLVRIVLVGFTFGNTFSMVYGLSGGILSMAVMAGAKRCKWFGTTGISILAASYVTGTFGVFSYFPVLLAAGVAAGGVIGLLGGMVVERIKGYALTESRSR